MNRLRLAGLALALTAALSVAAVSSALAARSGSSQIAGKAAVVRVRVSAGEFFFRLSTRAVKAPATVIFTVKNSGQVPHDFEIVSLGRKTPLLESGQSATMRVVFKHKGRFQYICTVPRHAEQGMSGTFLVK